MSDIERALKGQYHAGRKMLRECIEKCPEDRWLSGTHPRNTWRIAYHAIFCTHLCLQVRYEAFEPWEMHCEHVPSIWDDERGPPPVEPPHSKVKTLEYLSLVDAGVDDWVDKLGLETSDSGFYWYSLPKLEHQLLNIRHLGGHVGQLSELVMARGTEMNWVSTG